MIRYLLDEHVPLFYQAALFRQDPTLVVLAVGDENAPKKRTPDPDILRWCEENEFILVTNNRKTMPVHLVEHLAQGRHIPGILTCKFRRAPVNLLVETLVLIAGASLDNEYQDRITYLTFPRQETP